MKKHLLLTLAFSSMVLLGGCGKATQPQVENTNTQGTGGTVDTAINIDTTAQVVAIAIKDFKFNPDTITVKAGTSVTWANQDSMPHTITADDTTSSSSPIDSGASFSYTFGRTGSFNYHCSIHPSMKGTIIVSD